MLLDIETTDDGTRVMQKEDLSRYLIYFLSDEYSNKINKVSHPLLTVLDIMHSHQRERSIIDLVDTFFYDGEPTDKLFALYKELLDWDFIKHNGYYYIKD